MKTLRIRDFVNGPLKNYSDYDNRRSLPNIIDGLNMSQRKALAAAIDMKSQGKVKVSSLAARAVDKFAYHHGDSIMGTVVGLAQGYSGTNNINLLSPLGQFGNVMSKEHPAPRYISTKLDDNFFEMFKEVDLSITEPMFDDGEPIEPSFYIPCLPMILINGADGTGFGFKSFILQHDPKELRRCVETIISDPDHVFTLTPWLKNWKGSVSKDTSTRQVTFKGVLKVINKTTIHITELPVRYDLVKYKEHLNELLDKDVIKAYQNKSTDGQWLFEITCKRELVDSSTHDKLVQLFGLIQRETETVVCWGVDKKIRQFASTEELLREWVKERLILAEKSLIHQLKLQETELAWLKIRSVFVDWCIKNMNFVLGSNKQQFVEMTKNVTGCDDDQADRLVSIRVFQLTQDEIEKMNIQVKTVEQKVLVLSNKTAKEWYVSMLT